MQWCRKIVVFCFDYPLPPSFYFKAFHSWSVSFSPLFFRLKPSSMKNTFFTMLLCAAFTHISFAQRVGINTTNPQALLHVADSAVVFSANGDLPLNFGLPPIEGEGRRMMWYPSKAAFRSGYVETVNWNKDNIGYYSFGAGYNVKPSGSSSVSLGNSTTANGFNALSAGNFSIASGTSSSAFGNFTTASGQSATAMGNTTIASGIFSTAMGSFTTASGTSSAAMGLRTIARGYSSLAVGMFNDPLLNQGEVNSSNSSPLFMVGNGNDDFTRSNAFVVLKNGEVNFRGVIKNRDATFSKKVSTNVSINTSFAAYETKTFTVTWAESFSAAPEAYAGDVNVSGSGFAGLVFTVFNTSPAGATLYVYNARPNTVSANFSIKVIAIGQE